MFQKFIFLVCVLFVWKSHAESVPPDNYCIVNGRNSRDGADNTNVFLRKREQRCNIPIPGGGTGLYSYNLNKNQVPIIDNAMVIVTADNLDHGSVPTDSGAVYAIKLGGGDAVAGQILGRSLGGPGNEPANLFPQSPVIKASWEKYESVIYECLKSKKSSNAKLRWLFYYRTKYDTRPYKITYSASYSGGANNCANTVESFNN